MINDTIIELYKFGLSYRDISQFLLTKNIKMSRDTVRRIITKAGLNVGTGGNHPVFYGKTLEKYQEIIALHDQGLSIRAIAKQINLRCNTVTKVLKLNGKNTKQGCKNRIAS